MVSNLTKTINIARKVYNTRHVYSLRLKLVVAVMYATIEVYRI